MFEHDPSVTSSWGRLQPLLDLCTHAELTSAVLLAKDGTIHNVFSVLTLTRQSVPQPEAPEIKFLTEAPPKTVPGTEFKLAVARTTCAIHDALCAVPWQGTFTEPAKKKRVVCEGDWAQSVFSGAEATRLRRVVPDVGRAFWGLYCVPKADWLVALVDARGESWVLDQVGKAIGRSPSSAPEYATGFIVVLPEYRARLTVQRGDKGRIGVEYHPELGEVRPVAYARSARNDEFCAAQAVELKQRLTVLDVGVSDYEEVELHDLNSGMILDRHAGVPLRGGGVSLNAGERIAFDVALHDGEGKPVSPIHIETHWGYFQRAGWGKEDEWEMNQRRAAILEEQRRLHRDGLLFFYSGQPGEREKALEDIRQLVRRHARTRLWVWDPYFSGKDALEFLPYVGDPSVPVRVLTSLSTAVAARATAAKSTGFLASLCEKIRLRVPAARPSGGDAGPSHNARAQLLEATSALAQPRGNGPGMTDIAVKVGARFHDRFLVTDARCWQLGCSFNQIGNVYGTIVEFPYADLIVKAFDHEWNRKETKLLKDVRF